MTSLVTTPAHEKIDVLAKNYAAKRARVAAITVEIEDGIRAVHRKHRRALIEALAVAEGAQAALRSELTANPKLFEKPKTWTLHGIKVGYRKGSGKVEWEIEDDQLIAKIKKRFGELSPEVEQCIEIIEKIDKDALRNLDAKDLAHLGVTIEDVTDVPFIKAEASEADKLVKRLLKESTGRIPEEK
jgi:hypothetical protein